MFFTADDYVDILNRYFLPSLEMLGLYPPEDGRRIRLAQDNCSIHRARDVQQWFRVHNIELLDWPPYSPDLNIIENVWGRIVRNWENEDERTEAALDAHTKREWERYRGDVVYFENLATSMRDRIAAVREADGGHTPY